MTFVPVTALGFGLLWPIFEPPGLPAEPLAPAAIDMFALPAPSAFGLGLPRGASVSLRNVMAPWSDPEALKRYRRETFGHE